MCRYRLSACCESAGGSDFLIGVHAGLGNLYGAVFAASVDGHFHVGVVNELEENVALAVGFNAPCKFFGVEVEAHGVAVVAANDIVALAVAANEVFAVVTLDGTFALCHGVAAAPELDAVQHQKVGKAAYLVYGKHPECEEHEFVEELVSEGVVPAQEAV